MHACIGFGKPDKMLDDESEQIINYTYRPPQVIMPQQSVLPLWAPQGLKFSMVFYLNMSFCCVFSNFYCYLTT